MKNTEAMITDKLIRMQLTNARKTRNMTQQQISELSGLSKSCISNIESGEDSSPTLRSIIKYCAALGIDLYVGIDNGSPDGDKTCNIDVSL